MFSAARGGFNYYAGPTGLDPYWTSVSFLQNYEYPQLAFTDASTNNAFVLPLGDVKPSVQTPFSAGTGGSLYYDGTGDYLQMNASTAYSLGTGNFTFEAWVYVTNFSVNFGGYMPIAAWGGGSFKCIRIRPTAINFQSNSPTNQDLNALWPSSTTIVINTWYHVALVRSNTTTVTAYLNGTAGPAVTIGSTTNFGNATDAFQVGYKSDPGYWWGYISNWRLVKGTAVYTSNFTPSTSPLTAISGTSLLLNGTNQGLLNNSTYIDSTTTATAAFTVTGTVRYSGLSPFTNTYPGSIKFSGGESLATNSGTNVPTGTGAYTVEGWVYFTSLSTTQGFIGNTSTGGFGFAMGQTNGGNVNGMRIYKTVTGDNEYCVYNWAVNTWYHVATVRSGTTIYFFVNGVQQTTQAGAGGSTGSWSWVTGTATRFGSNGTSAATEPLTGYLSNWRTSNTALYTSNFTPSTTPLPYISGCTFLQSASGGFQDLSNSGQLITNTSSLGITTTQKQFNTQSAYSSAVGAYQTVTDASNLQFGTNDFTIELWVYRSASGATHALIGKGSGTTGWLLSINSSNQVTWTSGPSIAKTSTTTIAATTWTYIAITRSGTTGYMFINGTQEGATYTDNGNYNHTNNMIVGADRSGANGLVGYLDDVRITTGVCRYTATFTAPTSSFPTN